jgi:hypothetical protein
MKDVATLLNDLRGERVIREYALFGAVAQMRYTEPVATLNADVLVVVPSPERLDVLAPIYDFCVRRGYALEGESVRVGAGRSSSSRSSARSRRKRWRRRIQQNSKALRFGWCAPTTLP